VDFAPADHANQCVAGFLDRKAALHDLGVVARHRDAARITQEVGCVEHEDMQ
jgi:hypothetical protein